MTPEHDRHLAVIAESLYLVNLLLAPGLAFVILLWLANRGEIKAAGEHSLARQHLRQTLAASLWAGVLLGLLSVAILLIGGLASMWSWLCLILYFTVFHASLVLCGMFGLARAIAGQRFRYPLIGPRELP